MWRLGGRNADKGAQAGGGSWVGMRAKVRRRGAAGRSEYGRRCAGVGRLVGGNAGEGAQTGQSRVVGLGAKVRRRGAARGRKYGRRYADGAKPDRAVGHESGLGARGMLIGIHRSLSEPIGIYRRSSALFGFVLIDSDKF